MNREYMNKQELKDFGKRLRSFRQSTGVTMQDLSKESGVSLNTIARIERGEIDPKCGTAWKLWQALCDLTLPY